jgi:hypothetical protein
MIAFLLVLTGLAGLVARLISERDPQPNRWWISWIIVGSASVVSFVWLLVATTAPAWGALAIVGCTVATGVYLREITRFVGRWLSHPRNIVQLVTVLIVGYLVFLAVVSPAFRVQLFSLAIAVAALWLMWKALIVPLAPKKKKSS